MSDICILSNHGALKCSGEHLLYSAYEIPPKTKILPVQTEQFVIIGDVAVTGEAMRLIMKHEIPVVYMSHSGQFVSRIMYSESKNILLRRKQYALLEDSGKVMQIARTIVTGKLKNQIAFMQRIKRNSLSSADNEEVDNAITSIKLAENEAKKALSLEKLRGIEGNAAKKYFSVFGKNILPEWAVFEKRSRNPPETNVNAVLGFLYTLLTHYVATAIEAQGLDTMVGNLHNQSYGDDVLAFDLVEEFRVPVVDSLVCKMFNKSILALNDFRTEKHKSGKTAVYLSDSGIKKAFKAFDEKLRDEKKPYLELIMSQARSYKQMIMDGGEYIPYRFK